jgi:hypothetical protein
MSSSSWILDSDAGMHGNFAMDGSAEECFSRRLLERGDGVFGIFKGGEEIQEANHLEGLHGEFGGLEQTNSAARLFCGGKVAYQHANAAGIDGWDFFEVENDAILTLAKKFAQSGIKAIERRTHGQAAFELDKLDAIDGFGLNVQVRTPGETIGSFPSLTPHRAFARVRAQVK